MNYQSFCKTVLILIALVCISGVCFAQSYTVHDNSISFSDLKIEILTPTMIRIQKNCTRAHLDTTDLSIINSYFPSTHFTVTKRAGAYRITTDSLSIVYDPQIDLMHGGFSVSFRTYRLAALGEKDTLNLGGVVGSLDNCNGNIYYQEQNDVSSSHEPFPIPDGILSRRGFTVLTHTPDTLYFYKDGEEWNDVFVLSYGSNYRQAFSDFYQLTGNIPMLPKWTFGLIYSRWKDYNENDYRQIVARFRRERIPLDAIILDMCWHVDSWYGLRYDTARFQDMRAFHQWTDSVHIKTGFNHHSGAIYYQDPHIREFCAEAGIAYDSALDLKKKIIRYDTRNLKHFSTFYKIYLAHLIEDGLDFHWVDGKRSIYLSEFYQRYTTEFTNKRPIVMNRLHENVLCNHRYPFGFSGDTYIGWETMAYTLEASIKGGNNGVYWSHDIGGYMPQGLAGYPPTAEIFIRWLQLGTVSPIFRVHAKKDLLWTPPCPPGTFDYGSRLPWEWGDTVLVAARTSIQLRYKLIPYIYTMVRQAHDSGIPLCRGLYIDYPEESQAYRFDEFLFGDNFLAAPILTASSETSKGMTEKKIWLPPGAWYDYFTQTPYEGNRQVTVKKSLFEFPLYVKAGSIIPIAPYAEYSSAPMDTLIVNAYTPASSARNVFNFYEDDGESLTFEHGQFCRTEFQYEYRKNEIQKIIIQPRDGSFTGSVDERAYVINIVHTPEPKQITVNGERIPTGTLSDNCWTWDAEHKNVRITLSTRRMNTKIVIEGTL